jgi:hypothetical protein
MNTVPGHFLYLRGRNEELKAITALSSWTVVKDRTGYFRFEVR